MIARATPWGTIQLGNEFFKLPLLEQLAVYAHEQGHLHHWHAWKRLWKILTLGFLDWEACMAWSAGQELEADRYAAERGHGPGLVSFLLRLEPDVESEGYPTPRQRIEALRHV